MDQLLGLSLLRLVDVLTLGRESDLVVVDDRDPHAWCIALDVPYHGRALQDQRVGDNVGWRDGKQIWPPGGGVSFICEERPVTDQPGQCDLMSGTAAAMRCSQVR
ncbi:hypothetical protein [Mycobacterium sp.]|jgi:hypothetical protein|uniref:hypothetical protein n=1 Tax=Mycobacterium sp. TaxID=1785 RepID=UPI003C73D296